MSEKQKNWGGGGVTVLVSEIKHIGNVVFLEGLVRYVKRDRLSCYKE